MCSGSVHHIEQQLEDHRTLRARLRCVVPTGRNTYSAPEALIKVSAYGLKPFYTQLGGERRIVGKRRSVRKNTGWKLMLRHPDLVE
jgi:hypothetical protein